MSSPILFSLFLADLEEFLKSEGIRGVSIGHRNEIIILAYADDIVLLADSPAGLIKILKALRKYCTNNHLEVNEKKTKIIIYKKGGRIPNKKFKFMYGDKMIEVVKKYTYLGIPQTQSASYEEALKNATGSALIATNSTLSLINSI